MEDKVRPPLLRAICKHHKIMLSVYGKYLRVSSLSAITIECKIQDVQELVTNLILQ